MGLVVISIWANRSFWADAYLNEREPVDLTITAVDLSYTSNELAASPFELQEAPNTRFVQLPAMAEPAGKPKVTITGGSSTLNGFISGPDGPLAGAEVVLQRYTTFGAAVVKTQTNEDGLWEVKGALGGRYRIRAYVPGVFSSDGSEVLFLTDGETKSHNITLFNPNNQPVIKGVVSGTAYVGGTAQALVFVANRVVDDEGKLVQVAAPNVGVTLIPDGVGAVLRGESVRITGADGFATFTVDCLGVTDGFVTAMVFGQPHRIQITPCEPVPVIDPDTGEVIEPETPTPGSPTPVPTTQAPAPKAPTTAEVPTTAVPTTAAPTTAAPATEEATNG